MAQRFILRDLANCYQNARITCGLTPNLKFENNQPFSISIWILTTSQAIAVIQCHQSFSAPFTGYNLSMNANGTLYAQLISHYGNNNYIDISGNRKVNDGRWHNIIMTYDGSLTAAGVSLYTDLNLNTNTVTKDTLSGSMLVNATFSIGSFNGLNPFLGHISDVQIYNSALTSDQREDLYYKGSANLSSNLKAAWKINEGTGTSLTDTVSGYTGTASTGTWRTNGYIGLRTAL